MRCGCPPGQSRMEHAFATSEVASQDARVTVPCGLPAKLTLIKRMWFVPTKAKRGRLRPTKGWPSERSSSLRKPGG